MYVLLRKAFFCGFLDDFGLFLVFWGKKNSGDIKVVQIQCSAIISLVYLTKFFFYYEYFDSYIRKTEKKLRNQYYCVCIERVFQLKLSGITLVLGITFITHPVYSEHHTLEVVCMLYNLCRSVFAWDIAGGFWKINIYGRIDREQA